MNGRAGRLRSIRLLSIASVLAVVVAACAGTNDEIPDDGGIQTISGHGGHPPSTSQGSEPVSTPAQLVGLDGDQLDDLLGPADFMRSDGPAEIRQYRDNRCVLDLFLYANAGSGRYQVTHVEARDRLSAGVAEQACVADLLRARHLGAAG